MTHSFPIATAHPLPSFQEYDNNKNIHAKQNKYIWIPKNLNIHDRNDYISSYMYEVCNSKNYNYVNK